MATVHMSHDEFFSKLTALFAARQGKASGTINLAQKRYTSGPHAPNGIAGDLEAIADPLPILVRAHDGTSKSHPNFPTKSGSKTKLSTVVEHKDLESFYARYADVCKIGMSGLKKRDRKKAKSKKGKGSKSAGSGT